MSQGQSTVSSSGLRWLGWKRAVETLLILAAVMLTVFFCLRAYPISIEDHSPNQYSTDSEPSESNRYKYGLPAFYFSFLPDYLPKNHHRIRRDKEEFLSAAKQWKNSSLLTDLWLRIENDLPREQEHRAQLALAHGERSNEVLHLCCRDELSHMDLRDKKFFVFPKAVWYGKENQFHYWLKRAFHFEGSTVGGRALGEKFFSALKWTLLIQAPAFLLLILLGIALGIGMNLKGGKLIKSLKSLLYFTYSIPLFALAMLLILFAVSWLPGNWWSLSIVQALDEGEGHMSNFLRHFKLLYLPWICLIIHNCIYVAVQTDHILVKEKKKRYVLAAQSRGFSERNVTIHQALPNAFTPLLTMLILMLPAIITGSIVIELIFNIPGIGRLFWSSLFAGDWAMTLFLVFFSSLVSLGAFWVGDFLYYRRQKVYR